MKNLINLFCVFAFLSFSFQVQSQKIKEIKKPQLKLIKAAKGVEITTPENNQGVKSPLTVKGTSDPKTDISLQIVAKYTGGEQDLGTFNFSSDSQGKWTSTPINLWLPDNAKNAQFDIIASKSGNAGQGEQDKITVKPPSNVLLVARKDFENIQMKTIALKKASINESLLESLKMAAPNLTSPKPNEQVSSPLIVKGTGEGNNAVEVKMQAIYTGGEQDLGVFRTNADASGNWQTIPINLWAPEDAKNIKYKITATQFDEDNAPSRAARVTAVPKQGQIMVLNSPQVVAKATIKPKLTKAQKRPDIKVPDLGPVDRPMIISPSNGIVSRDGRFQIMGTGTPGHKVKSKVDLQYFSKRNKKQKSFNFDVEVDENGIWRTDLKNYPVPEEAYDIQYSIASHQIRPVDKKTSESDNAEISQMISSPNLTHFSYKAPDFPSTGTGTIIDFVILNKKFYERVYLKGEGGAGLKVKIVVDLIKNGAKSGSRPGIVDVDNSGRWKWDTGWRVKNGPDTVDSFIVKITQSNPGDETDKSETIVEYRTK